MGLEAKCLWYCCHGTEGTDAFEMGFEHKSVNPEIHILLLLPYTRSFLSASFGILN